MAKFLAIRITGGFLDYKDVPVTLKEQTKEELSRLGREDLAVDGAPNV